MPDDEESIPPEQGAPVEAPGEVPEPGAESGARGFVADAVRKAVLTGLGAVFLTEEGARKLAREWKLPKEIVGYVITQAGSAKGEILRVIDEEIRKFFESEALRREFLRLLSSMSIEITAEIRLKPARGGHVKPEVKIGHVRGARRNAPPEAEPDE